VSIIFLIMELIVLAMPATIFFVRKPKPRGAALGILFSLPCNYILVMIAFQLRWAGLISVETNFITATGTLVVCTTVFLISIKQDTKDRKALRARQKEVVNVVANIAFQKASRE